MVSPQIVISYTLPFSSQTFDAILTLLILFFFHFFNLLLLLLQMIVFTDIKDGFFESVCSSFEDYSCRKMGLSFNCSLTVVQSFISSQVLSLAACSWSWPVNIAFKHQRDSPEEKLRSSPVFAVLTPTEDDCWVMFQSLLIRFQLYYYRNLLMLSYMGW